MLSLFRYFYLIEIKVLKLIYSIIIHFFKGLIIVITLLPKYFIEGLKYAFSKEKQKKLTTKEQKTISFVILALALIVYLLCVFLISRWYVQKLKIEFLTKDIIESTTIIEEKEEVLKEQDVDKEEVQEEETNNDSYSYYPPNADYLNVDFNNLLNTNSDTVGWIKIDNTKVNYPIVQSTNNSYYLNHSFYGYENANGWIFGDYRDDFTNFSYNTIIYGHNLIDRSMFGSLAWTLKEDWYTNNKYIKISTPTSNSIWEIFSIYTIEPETYYIKTYFTTDVEYEEFLSTIKGRSIHNFGLNPTRNDKTLTLSTCDDAGLKRIVIHAMLTSITYK